MPTLDDALARLDESRRRHGLVAMPPGLPESQVRELLDSAGVAAHDHVVTWYVHYGPGRLSPGAVVYDLPQVIGKYLDLVTAAQDWRDDADAYSECVDWFPLAYESSKTVIWVRELSDDPPVARQTELSELDPAPGSEPVTLPELVLAWTDRFDRGYYTEHPQLGIPWLEGRASDAVRRRSGL